MISEALRGSVVGVRRGLSNIIPPLVLAAALIAIWELYVNLTGVSPRLLPAPSAILRVTIVDFQILLGHALVTLTETLIGFGLALVAGMFFALLLDVSSLLRRAIYPLLVASQTVPIIAIAPLLVLWFGFGLLPKVLVVGLVCFFPIAVAAADGLRSTDPDLIKLFRTFGAGWWTIFSKVRFINALPAIFSGLRIAITYSVIGAIFGEYVGAQEGLGIYMQRVKNSFQIDRVFASILFIAVLSIGLFLLTGLIERLLLPWHHAARNEEQAGDSRL